MVYILKYLEQGNVYMNYSISKLLDYYIPFLKRICPAFEKRWIKAIMYSGLITPIL
jgi:hypothetical protein